MPVDLTGPRRAVRKVMNCTVRVARDSQQAEDDVLDPVTLRLSRPTGDWSNIWAGPAFITQKAGTDETVGDVDRTRYVYAVKLPAEAPRILPGDSVVIVDVDSGADPTLRGRTLLVDAVDAGSMMVWRALTCREAA